MTPIEEHIIREEEKRKAAIESLKKSKFRAKDVAKACGISQGHFSKIRNGECIPSPKVAKRMSKVTGIPVLKLLYPEDRKTA